MLMKLSCILRIKYKRGYYFCDIKKCGIFYSIEQSSLLLLSYFQTEFHLLITYTYILKLYIFSFTFYFRLNEIQIITYF